MNEFKIKTNEELRAELEAIFGDKIDLAIEKAHDLLQLKSGLIECNMPNNMFTDQNGTFYSMTKYGFRLKMSAFRQPTPDTKL